MRILVVGIALLCCCISIYGQDADILSLSEYLAYVKKYHPLVKQANLILTESEAKLLKARGAFDPKLEVDYNTKAFKSTNYFDRLNTAFKIPTWFGVEFKGGFDKSGGDFLNQEATLPNEGLYSVGVSVSLAKGLLTNERMATLKQAKLYQKQAMADNQLMVNQIIYDAILAYFKWLKKYREKRVYISFVNNAKIRFEGVKKSYRLGERPAIDTTEARIAYNNRQLNLQKAELSYIKSTLALSNYLWINNIPIEIKKNILPDLETIATIDESLNLTLVNTPIYNLNTHPKLQSLNYKSQSLQVEKRLKQNNLLPKIDLDYNFLTQSFSTFNIDNYKARLTVKFPIFLRKERADLKITNYKIQALTLEREYVTLSLQNKINTTRQEIISYQDQILITNNIVSDYSKLLSGEERKFTIGESSLFLINSREAKLIESKLKAIEMENLLLKAKGKLFNIFALQ